MTTGVYKITNLVNGKVYIGASKDIERRWREHKRRVSSPIHSDLEALGVENFKFETLLECPETMLAQWERDMICLYDSDNPERGYNDRDDRPYSLKLSEALKGRSKAPFSEEHKRKISEARKGKSSPIKGTSRSDEIKRRISGTLKGHTTSDETRRKISEACKGHKLSEETKRKISESMRLRLQKKKENL